MCDHSFPSFSNIYIRRIVLLGIWLESEFIDLVDSVPLPPTILKLARYIYYDATATEGCFVLFNNFSSHFYPFKHGITVLSAFLDAYASQGLVMSVTHSVKCM
jgi:hypothetical protein